MKKQLTWFDWLAGVLLAVAAGLLGGIVWHILHAWLGNGAWWIGISTTLFTVVVVGVWYCMYGRARE